MKELDFGLDMNTIIMELTAQSLTVWSSKNKVLSSILSVKYSILHKITLTNWLPSLHKTYVSKDMVVLLFLIGTGKEFDMGKLLFEVIVYNAEQETTYGILPLPLLIYEVLMRQHKILGKDEILEILPHSLCISQKMFKGKHARDVQKHVVFTGDVLENVFTSTDTHVDLVQYLSSNLMQIRKKRQVLAIDSKKINDEDAQLAARKSKVEMLLASLLPKSLTSAPQTSCLDPFIPDSSML